MPRYILWQYQVKAEPVLVPAAAPEVLLEWWAQSSEPIRPRWRPDGVHVGGFEPIPAFDWVHQVSQPLRRVTLSPLGGESHVAGLEDWPVLPSEWFQQASEPVRVRPPSPEGGHFAVYALAEWPEAPVLLEWYAQASEPVRAHAPRPAAGFTPSNWVEPIVAITMPIIGRDGVHSAIFGGQIITGF